MLALKRTTEHLDFLPRLKISPYLRSKTKRKKQAFLVQIHRYCQARGIWKFFQYLQYTLENTSAYQDKFMPAIRILIICLK